MVNATTSLAPRAGDSAKIGASALPRLVPGLVVALLAISALSVLIFVHQFALSRFFTIDEYQWGHATWLVADGQVPYRDFYEHHLPLGYLLHSLLLPVNGSFIERALLLRKISFAYVLLASSLVAVAAYVAHRDIFKALLCLILPVSVGFGLMSAIDYRGDNWSAFLLISCFSLLEINRTARRRWLTVLAGAFFSCAVLMTQKTLLLGGLAVLVMLALSVWQQRAANPPCWLIRFSAQQMAHPMAFCVAAAIPVLLLLALGAWYGQLGRAFEINVTQALLHEKLYPRFSAWRYIHPFLVHTPWSSAIIGAFALAYFVRGLRGFWTVPTAAVLLGGLRISAPYPYNYVLASYLIGLCAVRSYCGLVRWSISRWPVLQRPAPFFYLLPLLLLPAQLGFVQGGTTNLEQLETLRQIEIHSGPKDVVIDSAGSALFRPHRGYYWYQGRAHVKMFEAYFQGGRLVEDLRASQAPFWIGGVRSKQLPEAAQQFLLQHYVPFRGDLYALGFLFPKNSQSHPLEHPFDVVRAGEYYVFPSRVPPGPIPPEPLLRIDGTQLGANSVHLEVGPHQAAIGPGAPAFRLSYLPPSAFDSSGGHAGWHAPLFEYDRPR